jgi:hypothetical protein
VSSWAEFEKEAPELAASIRRRFDAHGHKTLATLRRDGSPRISGTEAVFEDGVLWIGSMPNALKARDLQRDPRFALHSASEDPDVWTGDAKVAGVAHEVPTSDGKSHRFNLDIREASTVELDDERKHLVITAWTPEGGVRTMKRE